MIDKTRQALKSSMRVYYQAIANLQSPVMATIRRSSSSATPVSVWPYVWLGILAHLVWGSYPVLAKRAVAEVPKFSLLLLASLMTLLVGILLLRRSERQTAAQVWGVLRQEPVLWALAVVVAARAVTNILSIALTRAIWVSLINILTPIPVALLGAWFFGEPTPRYTYRALLFSSAGAVLMLVEDWSRIGTDFTPRDGLGLVMAFSSTLLLALYMQLVRRSHLRNVTHGLILTQQAAAMSLAFAILTLLAREDWQQWLTVSSGGLLAALGAIWIAQVGGNFLQIKAVSGANPALVTSLMALRLVSALLLSGLILGEELTTPVQWLGAALVIGTVTAYLWLQRNTKGATTAADREVDLS